MESARRPLRRAFLLAYLCGVLWYCGNCYWVRDTMMQYGDMPPLAPTLLLIGFSLVLGLYFGLFGLGVMLVRRATGSTRLALAAAPFLWAALELAAARITSVPWDQLGYSQVDNGLVNQLAPWTGVYGISFVLVAVNALIAGGLMLTQAPARANGCRALPALVLLAVGAGGILAAATPASTQRDCRADSAESRCGGRRPLGGPGEWDQHMAEFTKLAGEQCKTYIAGIPQTARRRARSSARPIRRIPIWWCGRNRRRRSRRTTPRFQAGAGFRSPVQMQAPLVVGQHRHGLFSRASGAGATTTPRWWWERMARGSGATTRFTWFRSASTFRSRTCCFLRTS